jgi:hypothetical protein
MNTQGMPGLERRLNEYGFAPPGRKGSAGSDRRPMRQEPRHESAQFV